MSLVSFPVSRRRLKGQSMSEYLIITALIAVAGIGVFSYFGDAVSSQVAAMSKEISGADGGSDVSAAKTAATNASTQAGKHNSLQDYVTEDAVGGK